MATAYEHLTTVDECRDKIAELNKRATQLLLDMMDVEGDKWSRLNSQHFELRIQKKEVKKRMEQIVREHRA